MEHRIKGIATILIIIAWIPTTYGIIGYDCGSPSTNLTTLSLVNTEECDIPLPKLNSTRLFIQLLQLSDFKTVKVLQCKVEIDRIVKKCGMFSHTSDVLNGKFSYIDSVSRDACRRMHHYGTYEFAGAHITGLRSNQTTSRPVVLAGHVNNDGKCAGGAYSDPYGTWADVIVLGSIKITLQDYIATVKINTHKVQLRSGVVCDLRATHCTDIEGGETFWNSVPTDTCKLSAYSVLYEGLGTKMVDTLIDQPQTIYSLRTNEIIFALTSTGTYNICGFTLIRTEHPKLFIFETGPGLSSFRVTDSIANLDIFTYMNSKFVYVEKHIRTQLNMLYRDVLLQQCNLELQTLRNSLAIATRSPDIFAFHFMKGPGYMALSAGEVIHIVKCVPVEVKLTHTQECYEQLPVLRGNQTFFLTPQTHILLRQGTQITCNSFAPSMYFLGESWYKFIPRPVETLPPTIIKPMTKPVWKYINPGALATSGIYTQADLDELKDRIMFPAERPAVLNTVARGIMGQSTQLHGGSISNLIDEASIEKIAMSTWKKIWSKFLIFGNISAGMIGIYLCVRGFKLVLDTLVHGYALHTVYGWSIYLIGAVWDSLTQLLLHLGKRDPKTKGPGAPGPEAPIELKEIQNPPEGNAKSEHTYPLLPPKETSTYSFELKG